MTKFTFDDDRKAAIALACVTLDRGKTYPEQCAGVRDALDTLFATGLARFDDEGRWFLTPAGQSIARVFLGELRATMRALGEKSRAA